MTEIGQAQSDKNYARTSPQKLAVLCILRAAKTIKDSENDTELWFLAIPELHRAVYSALVAALSGTHGTGAFASKVQASWLEWLRGDWDKNNPPKSDRVDTFENLLKKAQRKTQEVVGDLMGEPLQLSAQECSDLRKLNEFRDDIEHVKPTSWSLEVAGLPRIANSVVSVLRQLFKCSSILMHLSEAESRAADDAFKIIEEIATKHPSKSPKSWQPK